jgi:hypothetical protein
LRLARLTHKHTHTLPVPGALVGLLLYTVYVMILPHVEPLLWAAVLSIPLHALKTGLHHAAALPTPAAVRQGADEGP